MSQQNGMVLKGTYPSNLINMSLIPQTHNKTKAGHPVIGQSPAFNILAHDPVLI